MSRVSTTAPAAAVRRGHRAPLQPVAATQTASTNVDPHAYADTGTSPDTVVPNPTINAATTDTATAGNQPETIEMFTTEPPDPVRRPSSGEPPALRSVRAPLSGGARI